MPNAKLSPPYRDRGHIVIALSLLLLAVFFLFVTSSTAAGLSTPVSHFSTSFAWCALIVAAAVDAYICLIVATAADYGVRIKEDQNAQPRMIGLPHRGLASVILAILLAALVLTFARINQASGLNLQHGNWEAVYMAFVWTTTLRFAEYQARGLFQSLTVVFELSSFLLLLFLFFPVLAARLAALESVQAAQPQEPRELKINISRSGDRWTAKLWEDEESTISSAGVTVCVDQKGVVSIKPYPPP